MQFGEGGAGTFSDGKLYSQIKDPRHLGRKVLTEFVKAGAPEEILYRGASAYRHLPAGDDGGEHARDDRVAGRRIPLREPRRPTSTSRPMESGRMRGVMLERRRADRDADHVVLALGHSARDTFEMLHATRRRHRGQAVLHRLSHRASAVADRPARFGRMAGNPILGAADYKLVHHARTAASVYSFCMCPGGTVVAATSEAGRVVTNGMSQYSRNERNANAGIVVGITPARLSRTIRWPASSLQRHWEARAFEPGGGDLRRARRSWSATSSPAGPPRHWAASLPSYRPGVRRPISRTACPTMRSRRSARRCPPSAGRSRASTMRRRRADRRGDPHLLAHPHPARTTTSRA